MKKIGIGTRTPLGRITLILMLGLLMLVSCKDDYFYDDELPEWLGESIYDYLEDDGNYSNFIQLINDLNYKQILSLTGSKTLFVANDSAFTEFYKGNEWGVTKYEDLSLAQKKLLLRFSLINNAYLIETLSNYYSGGTFYEGTAMRRLTELSAIDSISFDQGENLSIGKHFDAYREKGIYLLKDNTASPTAYFTEKFLSKSGITNEDMDYISGNVFNGGESRERGDVHVFNAKVIKRDIVCKNGYIHVLNKVLIPPTNIASRLEKEPNTSIFSKLLERFAAPYYDEANTVLYRQLNPSFGANDSLFMKQYFASLGGTNRLPDGQTANSLLPYNPGWNSFSNGALPSDMATMFVPTDEAMNNYFNGGVGELLRNRFGVWDSVPDEIVIPFIKRHMRTSLIESVPSRFDKMVDAENYALPVKKHEIVGSYTGVNGQIFYTNNVYPPVDYISVYSPVLLSENSKIMNWAIRLSETSVDGTVFEFYKLYLNSLVSRYSLFIPSDEFFDNYIDPIAYGQDVPAALKYVYYPSTNSVTAMIHHYDKTTGEIGELIDSVRSQTAAEFIKNRLWNILDSHIVVGDISSDKEYYVTKANDIIRITGTGTNMQIRGGYNIEKNTVVEVDQVFNQANGTTYFINEAIEPALKSVYAELSNNPAFSSFFDLLSNVPDTYTPQIFAQQGVDYVVKFFNAFRYTIYVPTNEAIDNAIAQGRIKSWAQINAETDATLRTKYIEQMVRFLRYHFQDNAIFFGQPVNDTYQTATIKTDDVVTHWKTAKNKYYKVGVVGTTSSMQLRTEKNKTANVTSLNNIIVKDYNFARLPTAYKNVDGTGAVSGALFNTSRISNSASAVIHQIDDVLTFEE